MTAPFIILRLSAINGGLAVAAGAFAAHGLKARLTPDMLAAFETAARYHMYHALAMALAAVWAARAPSRSLSVAGWCFLAGIVLFSGSLYALALTGISTFGAITPIGGAAFIAGWTALAIAATNRPAADTIRPE